MRVARVQQGREADPPPFSRHDDQIIADGTERGERLDGEIAVLGNVERQTPLHTENDHQKQNHAAGQERDIRDQASPADHLRGRGDAGVLIEHNIRNGGRCAGAAQWTRDLRGYATPAKGFRRHRSPLSSNKRDRPCSKIVCDGLRAGEEHLHKGKASVYVWLRRSNVTCLMKG